MKFQPAVSQAYKEVKDWRLRQCLYKQPKIWEVSNLLIFEEVGHNGNIVIDSTLLINNLLDNVWKQKHAQTCKKA